MKLAEAPLALVNPRRRSEAFGSVASRPSDHQPRLGPSGEQCG